MGITKKYSYDFDQYEEEGKGPSTLVEDILADPEFPQVTDLIIGDWGNSWEEDCQAILGFLMWKSCLSAIWSLTSVRFPGLCREAIRSCGQLCLI